MSFYETLSDSDSHYQNKRGLMSRWIPNSKVSDEYPMWNECKKSGALGHHGLSKLFKKSEVKCREGSIRPIRRVQSHAKIPLAPPPCHRSFSSVNVSSSHFLSDLPSQYLARAQGGSMYSTFDSEEEEDAFVDAEEFSEEAIGQGGNEGSFVGKAWVESFSSEVWTRSERVLLEDPGGGEAWRMARALFVEDGQITSREKTAEWLGQSEHRKVLECYLGCFDFSGQRLESAFRKLCGHLYFRAEAQQMDRILEGFASRYWRCEPENVLGSADTVYAVAYSLLLLNTDLHVAQGQHQRMTRSEFVRNTMATVLEQGEGQEGWRQRVESELKAMYGSVRQFPILPPLEDAPVISEASREGKRVGQAGFYELKGEVVRKHLLESGKQKARHREWRACYLKLKADGELCMYAEETYEIRLNHTLSNALPPPGYNRQRPHVFAIQQADGGVYLFQTASAEAMQGWVSACNYWAARTSKEPLSGGVGNMEYGWGPCLEEDEPVGTVHVWQAPTATMVNSRLEEGEQTRALQKTLEDLNNEINQHRDLKRQMLNRFPIKSSPQVHQNWEAKAHYLLHEIIKYQNYCLALEKSLARSMPTCPTLQVDLGGDMDLALNLAL
ncbi:hypothetical protein BY458DRAFT_490196 [Sporodiniella umbellata]|nr:hypothetical protein BY458DRAFT_490196 [Sporodiniella umbellata]